MQKRTNNNLPPRYTLGLESKLLNLLDKPCAQARKFLARKFDTVLSFNQGSCIRHEYRKQLNYRCVSSPFTTVGSMTIGDLWKPMPISNRQHNFRVELLEDADGKLVSFSFSLNVR